ncbi:MAG: protein translocase subunit SecA [Patescibacteria group bacterium]|nr:MAG: protein translocase subunit SecA [Patescibacteria group bacterium]
MFKFIKNLFNEDKKTLDQYQLIVDQINAFEPTIQKLSDAKLAAQTKKFKKQITDSLEAGKSEAEALDAILPEAFATVREASRRVLGMRHFDVQLLAGIALHKGSVTEQKTGEGKTLTVTAPLYLNSLLGKGAHLITVNDYLAELGCGWMGQIYHFLDLSVAVIIHDHSRKYNPEIDSADRGDERLEHFEEISRKDAYACDITYGTNNEFGFDYLRDNMVQTLERMSQRVDTPHFFTIVDEADSILIDEARTPLIISAPDAAPTRMYSEYAKMVNTLTREIDYSVDEKARTATLTDLGVKRIEQKIGVKNLYEESFDTIHHIESALKAKALFERDKHYIVREGEVIIVDEHTGRLMFGRRYSESLHQAIEAKEGVQIQQESKTLATISIQNYFRMYQKLSGMTGTAITEAEEFEKIYGLSVLAIPTNVTVIREDKSDVVYKNTAGKYSAIVHEVERIHETGQPIMIGTKSIEHNQIISNFLKRKKIEHQVLNAKNHEKEAFIIADAGRKGAITVATNIAGRGVDIVLGGAKPELKDFRKTTLTKTPALKEDWQKAADLGLSLPPSVNPKNYKLKEYAKALETWKNEHEAVVAAGGLYILGTERHESRRIDNQLRGRSGRQGDPGSSQFFVSLEDEIMRIFGGEQIAKVMEMLKIEENQPIEHAMVSKSIESAQVKVEGFFFDQRKRLVEFDDVINRQRDIIYKRRKRLLTQAEQTVDMDPETTGIQTLHEQIMEYVENEITHIVSMHAPQGFTEEEYKALVKEFSKMIPFDQNSQEQLVKNISSETETEVIIEKLKKVAHETYKAKETATGEKEIRDLERIVTLSTLDEKWMEHIDAMDSLRQGIWLRGDKRTVLSEYKKEGFAMFEGLISDIESTIANRIYRVQFTNRQPIQPRIDLSRAIEQKQDTTESLASGLSTASPNSQAQQPVAKKTTGSTSDLAAALGKAKIGTKVNQATATIKIGRNDPCPCGSGLKYKKCGLINAPEHRA